MCLVICINLVYHFENKGFMFPFMIGVSGEACFDHYLFFSGKMNLHVADSAIYDLPKIGLLRFGIPYTVIVEIIC